MKCPKCGSEIQTENGHIGFCKNKDCSNNSGVDLAGYWKDRAEKAEAELTRIMAIIEKNPSGIIGRADCWA